MCPAVGDLPTKPLVENLPAAFPDESLTLLTNSSNLIFLMSMITKLGLKLNRYSLLLLQQHGKCMFTNDINKYF